MRSKGQLLGDDLTTGGNQEIGHLAYELAYEYWHKMLFAKFLEANNLLIHPDGVPVTLGDCEELSSDEGFTDKWTAAAFYASKMLPAIFRPEDPLMQVEFAPNDRINLESLLEKIEDHIYLADDALGWVYQFWQSEAKAAINASGDKIDGAKLPAVTQLFTEPYMVNFLIDNTIGAWWVSRHTGVTPPVKFEYLRLLDDGTPAAGRFDGWPNTTAEITMLDPCMGSGHFVVSVFAVITRLRMFEESLSAEEAVDRVIDENLNGLEIDPRCTQIAAFNLALTAWKFCGHYKELPEMNLACSGIAPKGKAEDWIKLVGKVADPVQKARMEYGMEMLFDHFQLAPELGSLIDPSTIKADAFTASFEELQPVLLKALEEESDKDQLERGVMAAGIAKAGEILTKKYTCILTNVPYLVFKKQGDIIKRHCEKVCPDGKMDIATVFLDRCLLLCSKGGYVSIVTPQNWLFLTTYRKFREKLLKNEAWHFVARLGPGAFSQITGEVVKAVLIAISHQIPTASELITGLDVSKAPNVCDKEEALKTTVIKTVNQIEQLKNPDARVVIETNTFSELLSSFADSKRGIVSGDKDFWFRNFWEIFPLSKNWRFLQSTFKLSCHYSGKEQIVNWFSEGYGMLRPGIDNDSYGKKGVVISQMGTLPCSIYLGELYDNNTGTIVPKGVENFEAIFAFCESRQFNEEVRKIDQKLNVTNATLVKVPFDLEYWRKIAQEKYPNGLPKPYSDDATQWLFHGYPVIAENPLQVATARLLAYRWPAESYREMELSDEARHLIQEIEPFNSLSDEDGIMCIPSVNGELAAAERLRSFLQRVWSDQYKTQTINSLLAQEGSRKTNLEDWLREEFFEQHCKLFHNRPFIWHIWDGRKDGFAALVNYHKLNKETLQRLIYTYLGDWIRQCESKQKSGESGAEGLFSAANKLREKLLLIQEGESPFDIFVRWKKLEEQPIGWDPDLNDGVRLNIRPFIQADVLKKKPNIKWGIDRGKNPPGSPWGEIRDNDKHLTLEEKRAARDKINNLIIKTP
ncbi:MAG: type II restriction endonuclease subunit M [Bacteroidia bacterium]|nr:type II restriction endonuclease subunit M [Bacteroidia bacterium]